MTAKRFSETWVAVGPRQTFEPRLKFLRQERKRRLKKNVPKYAQKPKRKRTKSVQVIRPINLKNAKENIPKHLRRLSRRNWRKCRQNNQPAPLLLHRPPWTHLTICLQTAHWVYSAYDQKQNQQPEQKRQTSSTTSIFSFCRQL